MGIIIVEGVDGAGKTTLLKNLRETSRNYFWIASSSGRPKTLPELTDALHWIGQASYLKLPVICDRYPLISENVYGPVLRGTSLVDKVDLDGIQVNRIIYCRPPDHIIKTNVTRNKHIPGVAERLSTLLHRYDDLISDICDTFPVIKYDYTSYPNSLDDLFFGRL